MVDTYTPLTMQGTNAWAVEVQTTIVNRWGNESLQIVLGVGKELSGVRGLFFQRGGK